MNLPVADLRSGCAAPRRFRAFTLVEMMIVIAIVALLVTLAAPSFNKLMATQRVRGAASDLHSTFLTARSNAITRNVRVKVTPVSGDWKAGWAIATDETPALELQQVSAREGITFTTAATEVEFRVNGRVAGDVKVDIVSASESSIKYCVLLDASGRPRTLEGACP